MVANYRCNEIKDESLETINEDIVTLNKESNTKVLSDFESKCTTIVKKAITNYDEQAGQYQQAVYKKVQKEMIAHIFSQLFLCFDAQLKMLR